MVNINDYRQSSAWSFAELTPAETQYLTHGYHRYPAKFIPQLVRQLIEEYSSQGDRICDPFVGCKLQTVDPPPSPPGITLVTVGNPGACPALYRPVCSQRGGNTGIRR